MDLGEGCRYVWESGLGTVEGRGNYSQDILSERSLYLKKKRLLKKPFLKKREQDVQAAPWVGGRAILTLFYCFVNFGHHTGFHSLKCGQNVK